MKKLSSLLFIALFLCAKSYSAVPFNVEIEQISIPNSPSLHSFAFAQYNGKWLFIGGRTNGLHGFSNTLPAFPRAYANRYIYVVDPNTNQVWSKNIYTDLNIAVADPLKTHNMEYYQNGQTLVMIGGMGLDSLRDSTVTFTTITAINVPGIINAVVNNQNISSYVTQISDSRMQVCGGELSMIGNDYYLVGGHNFSGQYRSPANGEFFQKYTNQYKKFNLNISGTITVSNYVAYTDSVNLHRRDMNLVPMINPDGSQSLSLYGGVFKYEKDLPYQNPVYINSSNYSVDNSFSQRFQQYSSAFLNMYDSVKKDMHTVFFGGTSLYYCDGITGQVKMDTLVPFIKDITSLSKLQNGTTVETILPIKFTEYLGTNAKFIPVQNIQEYSNGVVKLNQYATRTLVGYMFGGIKVPLANYTSGTASDRIFKIYLTYSPVGINQISSEVPSTFSLSQNYPNPFNPTTSIKFNVSKAGFVKVIIYNSLGREVEQLVNNNLSAGKYEVNWNASNQTSGVYFYKLVSENFSEVKKMMLVK
ncbi:MAG: T9SS type A sorting domain-containing protein [Bacteroidetes bacterium]|nr:T9SS type A sorting domain-containing protein [Bacteroidota bacterium]